MDPGKKVTSMQLDRGIRGIPSYLRLIPLFTEVSHVGISYTQSITPLRSDVHDAMGPDPDEPFQQEAHSVAAKLSIIAQDQRGTSKYVTVSFLCGVIVSPLFALFVDYNGVSNPNSRLSKKEPGQLG